MKKNTMMRIASVLLIAVLMTTCVISGTFAKYVSNAEVSDSARVAKWGWGDADLTLNLFDENLLADTGVSTADGALVAPGTQYSATLAFAPDEEFAPEVAYQIDYTVAYEIGTELEAQMDWTLKVGAEGEVQNFATLAELAGAIDAISLKFAPNTALTQTFTIGWVWAFEDESDALDTALGDMETLQECSISVTITATQLDTYTAG